MPELLENRRAAFAFEQVGQIVPKENSEKEKERSKEYRSLVRSFPAMILSNGYATAMAFLYSKKSEKNAHATLYQQILDWLKQQGLLTEDSSDFMRYLVEQDHNNYRMLTNETLALLAWLKRFAEGRLEK